MADRIDHDATAHRMKWHRAHPRDTQLVAMISRDEADLHHIAKLVRRGCVRAARECAARLDTQPRDQLPRPFFELLEDSGVTW